jgi:hypothetical protein
MEARRYVHSRITHRVVAIVRRSTRWAAPYFLITLRV